MGESSVLATWRAFELICDAVSEPCCSLEVDASSWAVFEALRAISILNTTHKRRNNLASMMTLILIEIRIDGETLREVMKTTLQYCSSRILCPQGPLTI